MKKIIYLLVALLFLGACEIEIDTYEGENGIYFDNNAIMYDTVFVAWGLKDSEIKEQKVKLKVNLFGNTTDYDRNFKVEVIVDPKDTLAAEEGVEYRPFQLEHSIPANKAETTIEIDLLRSPVLVTEPRHLTVRLIETPELKFLYSRETRVDSVTLRKLDIQRVLRMTENIPVPSWWSRDGYRFFGDYSAKKSILICDVMDINREVWVGDLVGDMSIGLLRFAGQYMHRWLQDNPTLDEDGEPMEMGPDSKI